MDTLSSYTNCQTVYCVFQMTICFSAAQTSCAFRFEKFNNFVTIKGNKMLFRTFK